MFLLMCFMAPGAFKMGNQPWPITVSNIGQLLSSYPLALDIHFRDLTLFKAQPSKWVSQF